MLDFKLRIIREETIREDKYYFLRLGGGVCEI